MNDEIFIITLIITLNPSAPSPIVYDLRTNFNTQVTFITFFLFFSFLKFKFKAIFFEQLKKGEKLCL